MLYICPVKKLSVKERIIETASDLFYNQGYNQTGINQIIDEANVAKASLYSHFKSKEDIAVAYLTARHSLWIGKLNEFTSKDEYADNKIIGCFDYLIQWLTKVDFRGCGWQNIITDLPSDQDKIKSQVLYHKNQLRTWIKNELNTITQLSEEENDNLGDQLIILIEGAIITAQIQKDDWPIRSAKTACTKLLI